MLPYPLSEAIHVYVDDGQWSIQPIRDGESVGTARLVEVLTRD